MSDNAALRSAFRKAAWRLPPFMGLLLLIGFTDYANVSFAAPAMSRDLGFTPATYAWGVGLFFFSYVLLQVPSNLALERVGARRWIAPLVLAWGLAAIAMAWVEGPRTFLFLRFLLGMAQAGLLPGLLLYLTYWFPADRRARMSALFLIAIPVSNALGAPLSGWILDIPRLEGALGLKSWQWLFILEGLPALLLGLMVYVWMPDRPRAARWLRPDECAAWEADIARGDRQEPEKPDLVIDGLLSPPLLGLSLAYFGAGLAGFGVIFGTPQIAKAFGLGNAQTSLVAAIPFAAAALTMLILGWVGDRTGKRATLVVSPMLAGATGLFAVSLTSDPYLSLAALTLAACGLFGALPAFWSLPTTYLQGRAAAAGFATINSLGALGGFVAPYIIGWVKPSAGAFGPGLQALSAGALLTVLIVAVMATTRRENAP